jgi:VIT1/CCC1 family predicted Fe2+/Mn2+ transporter
MGATTIAYWLITILFSGMMLMSGIGTFKSSKLINDFKRLGFPDYFRKQVGISKIIGAILLIIPFLRSTLKEWIYTGFVILLVSAIVAHFSVKDPIKSSVLPFILLAILFLSYFTLIQIQIL